MNKLIAGAVAFRQHDFETHEQLFSELGKEQKPHTLFIGCSDSRVVPNMITASMPGELFIVRNIANIVPPYQQSGEYLAAISAIEFAVEALEVENIVVCGHSNCGGCAALFKPAEYFDKLPHTRKWIELALPIKEKVLSLLPDGNAASREWMAEQLNVVEQIHHLITYPYIAEKYIKGLITISGWYYIIETGEIFNYNVDKGFFELIN
ncbi:MAG: carbonic anhydrase [Lentimicrobiaceae bacterium]|jgi:carbonic anhydrase